MSAFYFLLVFVTPGCPAAPAPPPQTDAWAVQISETRWRTEVPGWVPAPLPDCWTLGRVELKYTGYADTPQSMEPGPWIEGVDVDAVTGVAYKIGDPCPARTNGNCYLSPNTPKEPPAGCTSEFCVTP